jgi:molybdenum cofactor biosynthesis protein B
MDRSGSTSAHEAAAAALGARRPVRCAVLTVSDTRTASTDEGGALLARLAIEHGHLVKAQSIVRDDPQAIERQITAWVRDPGIDAVLSTGGTGIARRDTTIEVVRRLVSIELDGFGELFRMLSYQQVGGAAMLSRAVAGLVINEPASGGDTLVFAIPGSLNAIETAMRSLIGPQLAHLVWERTR